MGRVWWDADGLGESLNRPENPSHHRDMMFDPEIDCRCSLRLAGHDYAACGGYFVTVCVQGRERLFSEIRDMEMVLNDAGRMVVDLWREGGGFGWPDRSGVQIPDHSRLHPGREEP